MSTLMSHHETCGICHVAGPCEHSPVSATARCERCDREDCPTLTAVPHVRISEYMDAPEECPGCIADPEHKAGEDCKRHAVDWRARALAAEADAVKSEAYGDIAVAASDAALAALAKINDIRNSIVGTQQINWSEHIYPLVAALNEAGLKGLPYPEARANMGTVIEQRDTALAECERLLELLRTERDVALAEVSRLTAPAASPERCCQGWPPCHGYLMPHVDGGLQCDECGRRVPGSKPGLIRDIKRTVGAVVSIHAALEGADVVAAEAAVARLPYETLELLRVVLRMTGMRERVNALLREIDNPPQGRKYT